MEIIGRKGVFLVIGGYRRIGSGLGGFRVLVVVEKLVFSDYLGMLIWFCGVRFCILVSLGRRRWFIFKCREYCGSWLGICF